MVTECIPHARLYSLAPGILAECQSVLSWMERSGMGDTMAAEELRSVIRKLEEVGVQSLTIEELPHDFDIVGKDMDEVD